MTPATYNFDEQISWIHSFVQQTKPTNEEWKQYNSISRNIGKSFRADVLSPEQKEKLKEAYGDAMTPKTLQGHVLIKPHGYAGDYEIIDRFYTFHTSPDERLAKWDDFAQNLPAVKAVRNRKTYIKNLLASKLQEHNNCEPFKMLNLASGPARDLYEFFEENPDAYLSAECIDLDKDAIAYATSLLGVHNSNVKFHNKNILRFNTDTQYDLVWSAGLFDYFNDDVFKRLLTRFMRNVKPGGELVVGNFCTSNPDIDYMELIDWILNHRSTEDLTRLAMECGIAKENITVDKEPEGVNLFIRIRKQ